MNAPLPSPVQPIPIAGTAPLWARLPASARAALTWTQRGLREASRRLRTEPLNDELVAAVAESVWVPYRSIFAQMAKSFAANPESYRAIIGESLAQTTQTISSALERDADAIDTVLWIAEWLRSYLSVMSYMLQDAAESLGDLHDDPEAISAFCRSPEGGAFRSQVLMGAAEEEAAAGGTGDRIRELVDLAFLELCHGIDASREAMPWLPSFPFTGESPAERYARVSRYADAFRASGSPEDHATFHASMEDSST